MDLSQILPDWDFVGGSTQSRTFQLAKSATEDYDISDGTAYCSVSDYVNDGAPVLTTQAAVTEADNGKFCKVTLSLPSEGTKELEGCYRYQITIKDSNGNVSIPFHGRMRIMKNIAPGLLA